MTSLLECVALRELLAQTYTPEGVEVWLADAAKKGLLVEEALLRADGLAAGNFL